MLADDGVQECGFGHVSLVGGESIARRLIALDDGCGGEQAAALLVSNGHFKEGEVEAINSILLAGDKNPSFFSALAHIDGGVDPNVFETAPTKANLRRRAAVVRLTEYLATFGSSFDDSAVRIGEAIHEVTAPAYELAKVVAKNHETSRSDLATALIFHARSARTRQRNAKSIEGGLQKQIRLLRAKYRKELREKIHELIAQAAAIPSRRSFRTTSALGRLSPAA